MVTIVNGSLFEDASFYEEDQFFYGGSGRKTEADYKQLLIDSQDYFKRIKEGSLTTDDEYFVYYPEAWRGYENGSPVGIYLDELKIVSAKQIYANDPIRVRPVEGGYAFAGHDGRHRYIAAQRYGLDLMVEVLPEKDDKTPKKKTFTGLIKAILKL